MRQKTAKSATSVGFQKDGILTEFFTKTSRSCYFLLFSPHTQLVSLKQGDQRLQKSGHFSYKHYTLWSSLVLEQIPGDHSGRERLIHENWTGMGSTFALEHRGRASQLITRNQSENYGLSGSVNFSTSSLYNLHDTVQHILSRFSRRIPDMKRLHASPIFTAMFPHFISQLNPKSREVKPTRNIELNEYRLKQRRVASCNNRSYDPLSFSYQEKALAVTSTTQAKPS